MVLYKELNDYEILYMVEENDELAQNIILKKYEPIVKSIALTYKDKGKKCGLELEDLFQEGYIGLVNAMTHYSDKKDAIFYTYATLSIRSKILNSIKVANSKKNMSLNDSVSLYEMIDSNTNSKELIDLIENKNAINPNELVMNIEMETKIRNIVANLKFPHSLIFELTYNGFKQTDISSLLDISLSTIRNSLLRTRKRIKIESINQK